MTVSNLIELLKQQPQDAIVVSEGNNGYDCLVQYVEHLELCKDVFIDYGKEVKDLVNVVKIQIC